MIDPTGLGSRQACLRRMVCRQVAQEDGADLLLSLIASGAILIGIRADLSAFVTGRSSPGCLDKCETHCFQNEALDVHAG